MRAAPRGRATPRARPATAPLTLPKVYPSMSTFLRVRPSEEDGGGDDDDGNYSDVSLSDTEDTNAAPAPGPTHERYLSYHIKHAERRAQRSQRACARRCGKRAAHGLCCVPRCLCHCLGTVLMQVVLYVLVLGAIVGLVIWAATRTQSVSVASVQDLVQSYISSHLGGAGGTDVPSPSAATTTASGTGGATLVCHFSSQLTPPASAWTAALQGPTTLVGTVTLRGGSGGDIALNASVSRVNWTLLRAVALVRADLPPLIAPFAGLTAALPPVPTPAPDVLVRIVHQAACDPGAATSPCAVLQRAADLGGGYLVLFATTNAGEMDAIHALAQAPLTHCTDG